MRRLYVFIVVLALSVPLFAQGWASVNIDRQTTSAMSAAYAAEAGTELMNDRHVQKMLDHYTSAEVATAGIFASKWLDRKALQNAGLFGNSEENFYYRRIYTMVSAQIMPKIIDVAALMIKHPDKALYWGPYLFRVCEQTKQLCMTFETVVSNGKGCTFQDIAFLAISDNFKELFDLAKLGEVDWKAVWNDLADFSSSLNKEDLTEDLERLMTAGGALASAGGAVLDDAWQDGSKVGSVFKMKPKEIIRLYKDFKGMYETFSDPVSIKNLVMEKLVSTDSTGLANLFKLDAYNITSYISDYLNEIESRYYTQRWYIYRREYSYEQVCDYTPPMDDNSVLNGSEWYRVSTSDDNYVATSADREAALSNSESYAGWSRSLCDQLHQSDPRYTYDFYPSLWSSRIFKSKSGKTTAYAFAYSIKVYKELNIYEEVYEETFDSQYDVVQAIQARFDAKLFEYNDNDSGYVYHIGKGSKVYYNATDEARMRGCSAVSFTMTCNDNAMLGEGNFSWKENGNQRNALDEDSKRYAMESTLSGGADTSELDEQIAIFSSQVTTLQNQIHSLEEENKSLLAQISNSSVEDAAPLRQQYNENMSRLSSLKMELSMAQNSLSQLRTAKQSLLEDYADERDGSYRIPAVMHEIESGYGIEWSDAGSWNGYRYERHGNLPGMDAEVTFQADLTKERGESHFWGIRYHRAILAVHWTLRADYSSTEIVDVMEIDPELKDSEKAALVNARQHEIMQDHPDCSVEANYAYSSPPDTNEDEDAIHLLWVCDRLAIARDVDYRLSKIYAQLVLIEKFMRSRETVLDYLRRAIGITGLSHSRRSGIGSKSLARWHRSASGAVSKKEIKEEITEILADEELQRNE